MIVVLCVKYENRYLRRLCSIVDQHNFKAWEKRRKREKSMGKRSHKDTQKSSDEDDMPVMKCSFFAFRMLYCLFTEGLFRGRPFVDLSAWDLVRGGAGSGMDAQSAS